MGNEPVYHQGRKVGLTTSGAFGFKMGIGLAFAYVEPALTATGTEFEVQLLGERRKATILPTVAYDPENMRLKA